MIDVFIPGLPVRQSKVNEIDVVRKIDESTLRGGCLVLENGDVVFTTRKGATDEWLRLASIEVEFAEQRVIRCRNDYEEALAQSRNVE